VTHREAVAYVEGLEVLGVRFGLERMRRLLAGLGNPERAFRAVHVVGSNGKSSTTRLAAAALRSQGLRTGAYLSPHVSGWRERIELAGRAVSPSRFAAAVAAVREAAGSLRLPAGDRPTQFEVLTAAALLVFAEERCEVAVVEAGLGGRYDATNVLAPGAVVVLTNVALEHTDLLGPTEEEIAREKLAVAADGSRRLVVGRLSPAAEAAVAREMARRGLSGWRHGIEIRARAGGPGLDLQTPGARYARLPLALAGRFQRDNLAVAVAAAERLLGRPLEQGPLRRALAGVTMPGRLEAVGTHPLVLLDGAHNPAGMEALVASLGGVTGRRRPVAVVSILGDKDAGAMLRALAPRCRAIVATRSSHPRASAPARLAALAEAAGCPAEAVDDPLGAVRRAAALAGARGAVLVAGSLYLLADVRAPLLRRGTDLGSEGGPARLARTPGPAAA
jgi:dihydrofolate synthase/folylpolyglutamate synthase